MKKRACNTTLEWGSKSLFIRPYDAFNDAFDWICLGECQTYDRLDEHLPELPFLFTPTVSIRPMMTVERRAWEEAQNAAWRYFHTVHAGL